MIEPESSFHPLHEVDPNANAFTLLRRSTLISGLQITAAENISPEVARVVVETRSGQIGYVAVASTTENRRRLDLYRTDEPSALLDELGLNE